MTAQRNGLNAVSENADQRAVAGADQRAIPEATVARLATYLRALISLGERGTATVSSEELAVEAGVNSAKLRKDLSYLGSYGVRGVGYDVRSLTVSTYDSAHIHMEHLGNRFGLGAMAHLCS